MINKASIYSLIVNKTINFEKTNDELMNMIMREKYHFEKNEKKNNLTRRIHFQLNSIETTQIYALLTKTFFFFFLKKEEEDFQNIIRSP